MAFLPALRSAVGTSPRYRATIDTTGAAAVAVFLSGNGTNAANITSSRGNVATRVGQVQTLNAQRATMYWCNAVTNPGTGDAWEDPDGNISAAEAHVVCYSVGAGSTVVATASGQDNTYAGTGTNQAGGQVPLPALNVQANDAIVYGVGFFSTNPGALGATPAGAAIHTTPGATVFCGTVATYDVLADGSVQPVLTWANSTRWAAFAMAIRPAAAGAAPVITGPSGGAGASTSTANIAENAATGPSFSVANTMSAPYPRLSGADAARFGITSTGPGSYRLDPVAPFNFEAPNDADLDRAYVVVFEASATVSQTCTITLTDVNEGPVFVGPAIGNLTFVQGQAIPPVAIAARFTDPEGLAITGSIVESLPAGLSIVSGNLTGTPSSTQAQTSYTPRGTDPAGNATNGTAFTITVSASAVSPSITTQPAAQSGVEGGAMTMSVVAAGTAPLSYQWQRQAPGGGAFVDIAGATAASYTRPNLTISGDNGSAFRVVVNNSVGPSVTSSTAALSVIAAPVAPPADSLPFMVAVTIPHGRLVLIK